MAEASIYEITTDDYRGCGEAWAAVKAEKLLALRYTDRGQANRRDLTWREHRDRSLGELLEMEPDRIFLGMASCLEFIPQSADLIPGTRMLLEKGVSWYAEYLKTGEL